MSVPTFPEYLAGKDAVIIFGPGGSDDPSTFLTSPPADAFYLAVQDNTWDKDPGGDETTNSMDEGYYSSINTIKKWSGNVQGIVKNAVPLQITEGQYIAVACVVPNGQTTYGFWKIGKVHEAYFNVKGSAKYNFDFESQGKYTVLTTPNTWTRPAGA